jgi:hypothetical protein
MKTVRGLLCYSPTNMAAKNTENSLSRNNFNMKPFYGHFPRPILLEQCQKKLLEVTNFVFIRVSVSFGYTNICLQMLIMQCNFHPFKTGMLGNVGVRIIANFPPPPPSDMLQFKQSCFLSASLCSIPCQMELALYDY